MIEVAFVIEADDPDALVAWLTEAFCERLGFVPSFALMDLVEDTFPAEWAEEPQP